MADFIAALDCRPFWVLMYRVRCSISSFFLQQVNCSICPLLLNVLMFLNRFVCFRYPAFAD